MRLDKMDVEIFSQPFEFKNLSEVDIGLKTIQLAVILAQDIIIKLKDTQSFVQMVQKLTQMFQSHALACVWFIKWIRERSQVLQELLLCSPFPEVREVFANLLSTTFGITIKNEESYLSEVEQIIEFNCE